MTNHTELYERLAESMGMQFPFFTEVRHARIGQFPAMVDLAATDHLSLTAIGLYCKLKARWTDNLNTTELEVIELFDGDVEQARETLGELFTRGCLLTACQADAQAAAWNMSHYGDPESPTWPASTDSSGELITAPSESRRTAPASWPGYSRRQWQGTAASQRGDKSIPPWGVSVVYFLYGSSGDLVYIGSSSDLWGRLQAHKKDKDWAFFWARGCADRESAYWLEAAEIITHRPPLNQDYILGNRPKHVPRGFRGSRCPKSVRTAAQAA